MASGILGQSALSATTNTTVYTVPASTHAVVNISVVNRSGSAASAVRLALSTTGSPGNAEWIEYDVSVPKNGVLERTAISLNAGKNIVAYSAGADVSVSVYGIEQAV
tara:strand:- start:229 stop:549 length:321 start_codon:yes stop_codon:yes gene_type:complete